MRPSFSSATDFITAAREAVPEKIERDCKTCSKRRRCKLVTLVAVVCPERVMLPVLAPAEQSLRHGMKKTEPAPSSRAAARFPFRRRELRPAKAAQRWISA